MGRKTVVLSGAYTEFLYWCSIHNKSPRDPDLVSVHDAFSLPKVQGLLGFKLVCYGNWDRHPDKFLSYIKARQYRPS